MHHQFIALLLAHLSRRASLLVAEHDLDAPWRPCDVEQREGRILRQGNTNEEVDIFRYVTEGFFDAYSWQTLETKAHFIAQVMRGDRAIHSVEDVALATLSYAEVKALASGNPLVIEKAGVDAEVAKLATRHWVWRNQRYNNEREISGLPLAIAALEKKVGAHEADLACVEPQMMESISVQLGGRSIAGPDAVGEALRAQVLAAKQEAAAPHAQSVERLIGRFGGFDLGITCSRGGVPPELYLAGDAVYYAAPYHTDTGPALVGALLATLGSIAELGEKAKLQLSTRRKRLADLQLEMRRSFEHELRLNTLQTRQNELLALLDLTKDVAGSHKADSGAALAVA